MKLEEQRVGGRDADELHDLVLASEDLEDFLGELARHVADRLSRTDRPVTSAVTVARPRKPAAIGAGSLAALELEKVQSEMGEGPCITAMSEEHTVYVRDVAREGRWPEYSQAAAGCGYFAVLCIPVDLDDESRAALSFFSTHSSGFTAGDIAAAEDIARHATSPLRLSLRIGRLQDARDDLASAMQSRTVIDMAIGVIMAQNRCGPDEAFTLLRKASNARNTKLRDVAASLVAAVSGTADIRSRFEL